MGQNAMAPARLRRTIITLLCIGSAILVASCSDNRRPDDGQAENTTSINKYGGVYRKALRNEPVTLDPAFVTGIYAATVVQQLFDGLVQFDADLNVIPCIAESWKASRDGRIWTFHLRKGVKFHNGREVTADDFVYSFTRILDPKIKSPRTWLFERVQGAEKFLAGEAKRVEGLRALDDYTLQITLAQPYAPFISMLGMAQAKVVPHEEVERLGARFGRQPVGTGPFRFVNWVAGKEITLQANEAYFEGRPFLDRLHYRIFAADDRRAILAEFEKGNLEDVKIPAEERQRLIDNPRYRFFRKPILATLFLWLNTRHAPLNNPKVRQAINYAINRDTINSTIRKNRFVQARGILPPGLPGYNPELAGYTYNPARARQLLAEAGYPEGKGLPPLELWSSVVSPTALAEHQAIKRDLQRIGIRVELHTTESWKQFTGLLGKRPRAMYRYAWYADFPDPDNFLFVLFHSQSANNFANYSNPEVDRLLEQAQREVDDLKRLQLYRQAEALITADAPTVNLVYYTFEHLFQPYVRGIELNALGERHIPMKKIWLDQTHHAFPKTAKSE
jgi:peptide/nickel transport system substrate-binding protein/oligopeptide transport system substrate-binding protein